MLKKRVAEIADRNRRTVKSQLEILIELGLEEFEAKSESRN